MTRSSKPGLALASLCASLTAITMNLSLLNVGLPTLARQLRASNSAIEWIIDGYALVFASFLLASGSLADRVGRRRILMAGLVIFGAFSAAAASSTSTSALIAARCGMGLGAAFVMPMTLSIITDIYPSEAGLRRAIGLWAATASAGAIVAPLLAGALLSAFWWGALFIVNIPIALVTLVGVAFTVPETAPRRGSKLDRPGVVLSILFPGGLVFALIEGPNLGWGNPLVLAGLAATAVTSTSFCVWELRADQPLIDIRCFRIPRFSVGSAVVAMQYFVSFGSSFVVTQYLQLVLGYSALTAGIVLMPSAAILMVVAPIGARLFGRYGPRPMITLGLVVAAVGAAAMTLAGVHTLAPVLSGLILTNLAIGLMAAGTTSMVMSAVPPEQAGMASGTQSTTRQLGGALGVAVVGSLLAARYSASVEASIRHTAAAPFASAARKSLAAALQAAPKGGAAAQVLARVARHAFVDGLHVAAWTTAASALASAIAVWVVLSRSPSEAPVAVTVEVDAADVPMAAAGDA